MCCDRHLEIPGVSNNTTGTLEQKKTNSWTPVGQATDKKAKPHKKEWKKKQSLTKKAKKKKQSLTKKSKKQSLTFRNEICISFK